MKDFSLWSVLIENFPLVFLLFLSIFDFVKSSLKDYEKNKRIVSLFNDFVGILGIHGMLGYLLFMESMGTRAWHMLAMEDIKFISEFGLKLIEVVFATLGYYFVRNRLLIEMNFNKIKKGKRFIEVFISTLSVLGGALGFILSLVILLVINAFLR